jgi:hypothetical protein
VLESLAGGLAAKFVEKVEEHRDAFRCPLPPAKAIPGWAHYSEKDDAIQAVSIVVAA